ncbi:hypothetical protein MPSEU_000697800 [Mayamaea pseudoterrestris]|nr:hypothetical protein MPSEU_000697800 [Mayamaea pseudoterrestris]
MRSASTSPSPPRQGRNDAAHSPPPVFLGPFNYNIEANDDIIRQRFAAVPVDASPPEKADGIQFHRYEQHEQRHVTPKRKYSYVQAVDSNSDYMQTLQRRRDETAIVPHEVMVQQRDPSARPCATGSSVPLYTTSKSSMRALFPLDVKRQSLGSWTGPALCFLPDELVVHRLVTLCFECRMHSMQLLASAMHDLVEHVTRMPSGNNNDEADLEVLLDKWVAKLNVPGAIVQIMVSFPKQVTLQLDALRILCHLGKLSVALTPQQCTSSSEAVRAVLDCLETHRSNVKLVTLAVATLIHMGAHFFYHEGLFQQETLHFLVHVILLKHLDDAEVQVEVLFLLGNLSCNLALAHIMTHVGAISAIIQSLNLHWQDAKVSEGGALALYKLSKWSTLRKHLILEHGGYASVFRISKTHPDGRVGCAARAALEVLV